MDMLDRLDMSYAVELVHTLVLLGLIWFLVIPIIKRVGKSEYKNNKY